MKAVVCHDPGDFLLDDLLEALLDNPDGAMVRSTAPVRHPGQA